MAGWLIVRCHIAALAVPQGAKNIISIDITTALWASAVAGAGSALLGAVIGVPLLFRQLKVWEETM
jgi:hypothetical protein